MKKLAKKYGYSSIHDFFNYCIDSYLNGQLSQCIEIFAEMNKAGRLALLLHIKAYEPNKSVYSFYFKLL